MYYNKDALENIIFIKAGICVGTVFVAFIYQNNCSKM